MDLQSRQCKIFVILIEFYCRRLELDLNFLGRLTADFQIWWDRNWVWKISRWFVM